MRKLMWFTIGFAASCGFCAYLRPESLVLPLVIVGAVGIFLMARLPKPVPGEFLCLGACLGLIWFGLFQQQYLAPAIRADGTETECEIYVTDYSWKSDYGTVTDGRLELEGETYSVRLYLNAGTVFTPGDTISGTFRLRYTPGNEEPATIHAGRGIFLLAYQRGDLTVTRGSCGKWECIGPRLSHWLKQRLRIVFPSDVFPFTKALLLGDGADLSYEIDTALKNSGIRHIIAVSGLHVMLLYDLINRATFQNKWLTAIVCLPVLTLFAAVAGFSPSVTRAAVMASLMVLARMLNREYDPPSALSFSVLVMLLWNPLAVTAASFQLTVGCVAGMQLCNTPVREWLKWRWKEGKGGGLNRVKRWVSSSVSVTLGAMSMTTPLSAAYFGTASLVGVLSNLLTLWMVNIIFNGLIVTVLVSLLSLRWAAELAAVLAWLTRGLLNTAQLLGNLPLAVVFTQSPYITAWLIFVYLLMIVFLLSSRRGVGQLLLCGALSLCVALGASYLEPRLDDCRVTMLDVGQGQSILLQSEGKNYLVDCGGSSDTDAADRIAQSLFSQCIFSLDGVILTHWDRDHAGALRYLQSRMDTGTLYAPKPDNEALSGIWVEEKQEIFLGDGKITLFGGNFPVDAQENGLCVLFEAENCAILITGDRSELGELLLLEEYDLPKVDLLVAGHHGSKYSTSERLLRAVQPETVFISVGEDNHYGHPAEELLSRLADFGCRVYRTDLQGTLIFRR